MVVNRLTACGRAAAIQRVEQLKVAGGDGVGGFMGFGNQGDAEAKFMCQVVKGAQQSLVAGVVQHQAVKLQILFNTTGAIVTGCGLAKHLNLLLERALSFRRIALR